MTDRICWQRDRPKSFARDVKEARRRYIKLGQDYRMIQIVMPHRSIQFIRDAIRGCGDAVEVPFGKECD